MDVSNIAIEHVGIVDTYYKSAMIMSGVDSQFVGPSDRKKMRRFIEKHNLKNSDLPDAVLKHIEKNVTDEQFFEFFDACHQYIEERGTYRRQVFDGFSVGLSEDVRKIIWGLIENGDYVINLKKNGDNAELSVETGEPCFDTVLILENVDDLPEKRFDSLWFEGGALSSQGGKYLLVGETYSYEEDVSEILAIHFTGATVRRTVFSAAENITQDETPWEYLSSLSTRILSKASSGEEYLNQKEKELVPLLSEIGSLFLDYVPNGYRVTDYPLLRSYFEKHEYREPIALLEKISLKKAGSTGKILAVQKLSATLGRVRYEPLWRELFTLITESQAEYPLRADTADVERTKREIEKLFWARGYSGSYPDFRKEGRVMGPRLVSSRSNSYVVALEKRAVFHIHCDLLPHDGGVTIEILSGAELLRKNDTPGDIYSCLFDGKDRRFSKTTTALVENEEIEERLAGIVAVAAKRAELKRPTKKEKSHTVEVYSNHPILLLIIMLLTGIAFGVLMVAGMMLLGAAVFLIAGEPSAIPEMITEYPWWQTFAFCAGAFGIAMWIVTLISEKR